MDRYDPTIAAFQTSSESLPVENIIIIIGTTVSISPLHPSIAEFHNDTDVSRDGATRVVLDDDSNEHDKWYHNSNNYYKRCNGPSIKTGH